LDTELSFYDVSNLSLLCAWMQNEYEGPIQDSDHRVVEKTASIMLSSTSTPTCTCSLPSSIRGDLRVFLISDFEDIDRSVTSTQKQQLRLVSRQVLVSYFPTMHAVSQRSFLRDSDGLIMVRGIGFSSFDVMNLSCQLASTSSGTTAHKKEVVLGNATVNNDTSLVYFLLNYKKTHLFGLQQRIMVAVMTPSYSEKLCIYSMFLKMKMM
jgi:hypothetical protein